MSISYAQINSFFGDELPARVEARCASGKREGDQQAQQGKHRAFGRAQAGQALLRISGQAPESRATPDFHHQQHANQPTDCKERGRYYAIHVI